MPEGTRFDRQELRTVALRFQEAVPRTAALQLATTFPPLLALLAAMHAGLALGHWWPVLALALPAAGLVVRVFALQHDCGHGSLFRSRRASAPSERRPREFCSPVPTAAGEGIRTLGPKL
jgi:acyl-lipid omega-6 desaturase (Delta-12 desaturase)